VIVNVELSQLNNFYLPDYLLKRGIYYFFCNWSFCSNAL